MDPWVEVFGPDLIDGAPTQPEYIPLTSMVVESVKPGSDQERAGLQVGDRVIGVMGLRIHGMDEYHLVRKAYDLRNREFPITVMRNGRVVELHHPAIAHDRDRKLAITQVIGFAHEMIFIHAMDPQPHDADHPVTNLQSRPFLIRTRLDAFNDHAGERDVLWLGGRTVDQIRTKDLDPWIHE